MGEGAAAKHLFHRVLNQVRQAQEYKQYITGMGGGEGTRVLRVSTGR